MMNALRAESSRLDRHMNGFDHSSALTYEHLSSVLLCCMHLVQTKMVPLVFSV